MKKLFLLSIIFVLIASLRLSAQNLVFSRVLLVGSAAAETVPVDKVWKICGVMASTRLTSASGGSSSSAGSTNQIIKVNNNDVYWATSDSYTRDWSASATAIFTEQPIWLPANTTLQASTGVYKISVIEFTVSP